MDRKFLESQNMTPEQVEAVMAEHGKSVQAVNKEVETLKTENETLKTQQSTMKAEIENANGTIQTMTSQIEEMQKAGADVESIQKQLAETLEAKQKGEAEWSEKLKKMEENFQHDKAVSNLINSLQFSSEAAKQGFEAGLRSKGLPIENGAFLGADDYVKQYRESDPNAFKSDDVKPPIVSARIENGNPDNVPGKENPTLYEALIEKFKNKGD